MSRLDAARRVLSDFHWTRARSVARRRALRHPESRKIVGYLDRVQVFNGHMIIDGWVDAPEIRLMTDFETRSVLPDLHRADVPANREMIGFHVSMRGARYLAYDLPDIGMPAQLRLHSPWYRVQNFLRASFSLIPVATGSLRDLSRYFLKGDTHAGDRLERRLLPSGSEERLPLTRQPIFGHRPCPPIHDPVDIIVPVYDALSDLQICLNRLQQNTSAPYRLIIVDDASPDPAVGAFLRDWCKAYPDTLLLTHDRNAGFVGAINHGLDHSRGHVVILNSDAFVPEGWLERLMAPLVADKQVASVTPMSNDAEIFCAPVECTRTDLRPGKADQIDRIAQRLDWQAAQCNAPTGVGFCMAMSRRWLDQVPRFDPAFGMGYGEEVDWCRKTAALGARHVGLGTLFVEHRGGASFGADKQKRVQKNNGIISGRYRGYHRLVSEFRRIDPMVGARLALAIAAIDNGGHVPVYLGHRLGGGAEFWLLDKIHERLKAGAGSVVIRDDDDMRRCVLEVHTPAGVTKGAVFMKDLPGFLAVPEKMSLIYSCLADSKNPQKLLQACLRALRPDDRLVVLFHDFFPICPSYNLIGHDQRFCGLPAPDACQKCYGALRGSSPHLPGTISEWRKGWLHAVSRADEVVVFSHDSRQHVVAVWPDIAGRVSVKPHKPHHLPRQVTRKPGDKVVVGLLGGIGYPKGAGVIKQLATLTDDRFQIVVIGKIDPAYSDPRITIHGKYMRKEIASLAERYGITCWFNASIWPETFSYAVHECLATGIPVYGFDLGAQGEALTAHPNGRVIALETDMPALKALFSASLVGA